MTDGYDPPGGNPPLPDPASPSGEGSGYPPQGGEAPPPGDDRGKGLAIAGGAALVIALIVVVILLATNRLQKNGHQPIAQRRPYHEHYYHRADGNADGHAEDNGHSADDDGGRADEDDNGHDASSDPHEHVCQTNDHPGRHPISRAFWIAGGLTL